MIVRVGKLGNFNLKFPPSEIRFHHLNDAQIHAIDAGEANGWCLIFPNHRDLCEWAFAIVSSGENESSGAHFFIYNGF